MAAAISVEGVSKRFTRQGGEPVTAVDGTNFAVREGEFVCIVGPSGCGKSTLLKILAGLVRPSAGRVTLHGDPIEAPRRDVGIVFQSPILLPWRTTLDNVMLPITIYQLPEHQYLRRAQQLIELVGLSGFERSYPYELSGGMQQRVAIARALVHEPRMLLMDEPFGALDAMTRQVMNLELTRIWEAQRKTVVLITHDISEAIFLADRVLVMSARPGRILETIAVDLPRPRPLSVMAEGPFVSQLTRIQRLLGLDRMVAAGH
jgi:NitT/TauT family transport system ATP-binding protein